MDVSVIYFQDSTEPLPNSKTDRSNSTSQTYTAKVEITTIDIATGASKRVSMPHLIERNCSTEVDAIKMDEQSEQDVVIVASLFIEDKLETETFSWPDP
jgi:hypothetical protein